MVLHIVQPFAFQYASSFLTVAPQPTNSIGFGRCYDGWLTIIFQQFLVVLFSQNFVRFLSSIKSFKYFSLPDFQFLCTNVSLMSTFHIRIVWYMRILYFSARLLLLKLLITFPFGYLCSVFITVVCQHYFQIAFFPKTLEGQ